MLSNGFKQARGSFKHGLVLERNLAYSGRFRRQGRNINKMARMSMGASRIIISAFATRERAATESSSMADMRSASMFAKGASVGDNGCATSTRSSSCARVTSSVLGGGGGRESPADNRSNCMGAYQTLGVKALQSMCELEESAELCS